MKEQTKIRIALAVSFTALVASTILNLLMHFGVIGK
jgi:hypothetical protein